MKLFITKVGIGLIAISSIGAVALTVIYLLSLVPHLATGVALVALVLALSYLAGDLILWTRQPMKEVNKKGERIL